MAVADLLPIGVSPTVPQAVCFVGQEQIPDLGVGTPRYGWRNPPDQDCLTHEFRVLAEPVVGDGGEGRVLSEFTPENTHVEMMSLDPWAGTCTGTGYRSPYRVSTACSHWPFSDLSCASRLCSLRGHLAGDYWLTGVSIPSRSWLEAIVLYVIGEHVAKALQGFSSVAALHLIEESIASSLAAIRESAHTEESAGGEPPQVVGQETHVAAIRWLEEHVGLSQGAIADLLGVSRQTVQNWLHGVAIRDENRQRLLAVREILQRAQRRHQDEDALKTWLDTPQGLDARTPRQLLMNNELGKARALALSTAPPPPRVAPQWLRESPPDPWTQRQRRRRDRFEFEQLPPELDADDSNNE